MSKRLVKTAQQQLEERLRSLTVLTTYKGVKDVTLYLCEDEHKQMSILRESEEWGYYEYKFKGSYQSMIESDEFLYAITCRFAELDEPVKNIFDWYASADKDFGAARPLPAHLPDTRQRSRATPAHSSA